MLADLRARLPRDPDPGPPVLLLLGTVGIVGSTRHVLDLAHRHGADGWPAPPGYGAGSWLVAGVWEVMAAFSGWEIKRRRGWQRAVPAATLVLAVVFVLAANLEGSGLPVLGEDVWRYVVAASPAVVFLSAAALVETRQWRRRPRTRPKTAPVTVSGPPPDTTPNPMSGGGNPPDEAGVAALLDRCDDHARTVYAILAAADPGATLTPAQIRQATGLDKDTAYRAVRRLVDVGLVASPQTGRYAARRIGAVA